MNRFAWCIAALATIAIAGCSNKESERTGASEDPTTRLIEQFVSAQPGDVIEIPEGTYSLNRSLTLNMDNITVRGAGMDKTILSFKDQLAGAEGVLVNASNFTIEDLAIVDTKGDALKVNEGDNIVIRRVRTEWTGGPKTENGAYGIYPVQTSNVLIEDSVAIGASDAGIYVGQSRNIIVRNNRAEQNVAGIEIENSVGADVYYNVVKNNTGGILVFSMPDLPMAGHGTRVYANNILKNNTPNFGAPGTAVAGVPTGTGILINSNDNIEIFENRVEDNLTANVLITSFYASTLQDRKPVEGFDGFPESIYIHNNTFRHGGEKPDREALDALRIAMFGEGGRLPDVVWDGFINPEKLVDGQLPDALAICLDNGSSQLLNADAPGNYKMPRVETELHKCKHDPLPAIKIAAAGE
ncbi:MAG: right-handed parallel beta-helix repeat-containing protein [Pseudomonadales bacterium]|nr:right-handed parallel beta-helix repeat-containing protein [Pseudomonadales bacterium]